MKLHRHKRIRGEGAIAIWIIVAALIGGVLWFLYSSRQDGEKNARAFANEVVQRIAVNYDEKYLHVHLSPEAQTKYLQSWRDRLMQNLKEMGPVKQPIEVKGDVHFSSGFFEPVGNFRTELNYPGKKATMELMISRGMTVWQVDEINMIWPPAPTPTPAPISATTPTATPTPTPPPAPEPKQKRNRKR
jgi:hypothetical protein